MRAALAVLGLSLVTAASACGEGEVTTSGAGGGGAAGGGGSASAGGATTTNTTTSTSTTTHPSCLEQVTFDAVHGCDPAALTDRTGMPEVTIGYGYVGGVFLYDPACVLVDSGTTVVMEALDGSNFQIHPLQGGVAPTPDPDSPFGFIADGNLSRASFTLEACGTFPYYCVAHIGDGMIGAVYVAPP